MGDKADAILQEAQDDVRMFQEAITTAMQPVVEALQAFGRGMKEAASQLQDEYMPLIRELDRAIRRYETIRAQMRRKGRPGWRHWRGHGRG